MSFLFCKTCFLWNKTCFLRGKTGFLFFHIYSKKPPEALIFNGFEANRCGKYFRIVEIKSGKALKILHYGKILNRDFAKPRGGGIIHSNIMGKLNSNLPS
jgi:hypothetical protein